MNQEETPIKAVRERLSHTRIFIVPYSHADWAWTHTRHWHEMRYVKTIDEVLDIIAAQERDGIPADAPHAFRWYADCYRTEIVPYLEARPDRMDELRRRVAEGRIAICGGYANIRINHAEGEAFLRTLISGRRAHGEIFPEANLSVYSDIVDVAVGHPQLPQILDLSGYRYLRFWRPQEALTAKGIPYHFVWEGLDGTRLLCSRGCYSGLVKEGYAPEGYRKKWDEVVQFWWGDVLQDHIEHSPVPILWLQHGADDNRPLRRNKITDEPLDLIGVAQEWNERETSSMQFATPVDVFAELEKERNNLPVIQGTLDPCDVSHKAALLGTRGLWRLRSECARGILVAETLDVLAVIVGSGRRHPQTSLGVAHKATPSARDGNRFERLWKALLELSCHATQWLFQEDFDEHYALAQNTIFETGQLQAELLKEIVAGIQPSPNAITVLFNPLPYERTVAVLLHITFVEADKGGVPEPMQLADGRGQEVPYQVISKMEHVGHCWEVDALAQVHLPAGGWNVISWRPDQPSDLPGESKKADTIENESLQLRFSDGRLTGIIDKENSVEWTAPEATPFGHLREYKVDTTGRLWMGPVLGQEDAEWKSCELTEFGPVRWAVRAKGTIGQHGAAQEVRLYRGEKRVEFHVEIDCAGIDGFIASHLPCPGPGRLVGDMPFCVEAKDLAKEPYVGIERQRPGMFIAQSFVDWTGDDRAMAYVSHDGDRYFVHDETEHVLKHILINGFLFESQPDNWVQSINRYAECKGRHEFTFSLVPREGDWRATKLWKAAQSLRTPPLQTWPLGRGERGPYESLLSVSPDNVTLSAFHVEGDRVLLRLFENMGEAVDAEVVLPFTPMKAQPVNLMGEPGDGPDIQVDGNGISMRLRPWQIVTLSMALPEG